MGFLLANSLDGHHLGLLPLIALATRVRRSYSLKAKISENVGIFFLALKRKKVFFFALFACKRNIPNSEKNESEMSQKRKEKRNKYTYFLTTCPQKLPKSHPLPLKA